MGSPFNFQAIGHPSRLTSHLARGRGYMHQVVMTELGTKIQPEWP
jgi:hypothetical protein